MSNTSPSATDRTAMDAYAQPQLWLTDEQRDALLADFDRDGSFMLPMKLPEALRLGAIEAIDQIAAEERPAGQPPKAVKRAGCVQQAAAFRSLMMFPPALQMCHDLLGPVFQLNQSNFFAKPREAAAAQDFAASSPWHADGPRPRNFPHVPGPFGPAMGLHYLKFAYFLTDLTHEGGGPLQVIKGTHRRPELDGKGKAFDVADYADDLVEFRVPAGTVVAFHQAQWHASPPNLSDHERKNLYISYSPTWMRPLDYELPSAGELADDLTDEEAFLLGEWRPPMRFWLPTPEDKQRLARYGRTGSPADHPDGA